MSSIERSLDISQIPIYPMFDLQRLNGTQENSYTHPGSQTKVRDFLFPLVATPIAHRHLCTPSLGSIPDHMIKEAESVISCPLVRPIQVSI